MTFSIKDTQHNKEYHCTDCRYAERRDLLIVILNVVMLNGIMLRVVMLSVVRLNLVAPVCACVCVSVCVCVFVCVFVCEREREHRGC
jgi:hypothetical protein